jgi:hypothetical protein
VRNDLAASPGLLPLIRTAQLKKSPLLDEGIQAILIKEPPIVKAGPRLAAKYRRLVKVTAENGIKRPPGVRWHNGIVFLAFERRLRSHSKRYTICIDNMSQQRPTARKQYYESPKGCGSVRLSSDSPRAGVNISDSLVITYRLCNQRTSLIRHVDCSGFGGLCTNSVLMF